MLRSGWLAFLLATASTVAWAQPAAPADAPIAAATAADQKLGKLAAQRVQLARRYQAAIEAVDRLKQDRASWRRDRELRAILADSKDTADQLAAVTAQLAAADEAALSARRAEVVAIDGELASGVAGARAQKLTALRAQVAARLGPAPKKIVIPDAEIDPLADPEELDQRAAALRVSEDQLARQVAGLDQQAKDLVAVADLKQQHDRAVELGLRDDDQPHRIAQSSSHGGTDTVSPSNGTGSGGGGDQFGTDRTPTTALETEAVVLGEVIDQSTIETLVRAAHSSDPAARAGAAKRARDAVAARLDQLRRQRAQIELRAKQLRAKR